MSIEVTPSSDNIMDRAAEVAKQVKKHMSNNRKLMLILSCYISLVPELIDAACISALGNYPSKAGGFIGGAMLGYEKRNGYSVTNLGNITNPNIIEATFIPPASPANKKTKGVLSVNGYMKKCTVTY